MNKLVPLLLFISILAASCSSSYTPSIDVGDNRIAINTIMVGSSDYSQSDAAGLDYGIEETSITEIDMTIGRVVAENLELGAIVMMKDEETDKSIRGVTYDSYNEKMNGLGAYARYYFPASLIGGSDTLIGGDAKLVPWIQGSVVFVGSAESTLAEFGGSSVPGGRSTYEESDVFVTALSIGLTSFFSENAAIEFAITQKSIEQDDFSGARTEFGLPPTSMHPGEYATERDSLNFTLGLSVTF